MTLPRVLKPASSWLPLQTPVISLCFVGVTAYWIFPYGMYRAGGSFLMMYVIMLVVLVAPVLYMDVRLGGITQRGFLAMQVKYFPIATGIGLALFLRLIILALVMGANACLPLWYMFVAGDTKPGSPYPWTTCSNPWNTYACDPTFDVYDPKSDTRVQPEIEYFRYVVMEPRPSLPDIGKVVPPLAGMLCLFCAFTFCLTCLGPRIFGWVVLLFSGLFLLGVIFLLVIGCCSQYNTEAATRGVKNLFQPKFDLTFVGTITALETALSFAGVWSFMLPTVGKFAGKGRRVSAASSVPILVASTVVPVLIVTVLGAFYGMFSDAHQMSDLYGFDFAYGRELTMFFIPVASRYLELHPSVTVMLFGSQVILLALAQGLIVLVLADSILEALYKRWLKAIKANLAMWRLLVTAVVCVLLLLLSLPLVAQNGMDLLDKASLSITKLDFVYYFSATGPLAIIYAQRKEPHLREKAIVLIWSRIAFALTGLLITGIAFLYLMVYRLSTPTEQFIYLDTNTTLFGFGPLMIGVPAGVLYAFLASKGVPEQRFVRMFDSPEGSSRAPAPESFPMIEGCSNKKGERPQKRNTSFTFKENHPETGDE